MSENPQCKNNCYTDKLERFHKAQEGVYEQALLEIKRGWKSGHWMWFIFPQLKGLGFSYEANYYGITNLEEANAYLEDPILGTRLIEISRTLLTLENVTAWDIFGGVDEMKLCSCMTLFSFVSKDTIFDEVLEKYFMGHKDKLTINKLT